LHKTCAAENGSLNAGCADEIYNILFRLNAKKMLKEGFACGDAGERSRECNVLERVNYVHAF
jgi:hypothetical protein